MVVSCGKEFLIALCAAYVETAHFVAMMHSTGPFSSRSYCRRYSHEHVF